MRERYRYKLPVSVQFKPNDLLLCVIDDHSTGVTYQFQERIGRKQTVDTVVTFDIDESMLGLVNGFGAIFGEAEKP